MPPYAGGFAACALHAKSQEEFDFFAGASIESLGYRAQSMLPFEREAKEPQAMKIAKWLVANTRNASAKDFANAQIKNWSNVDAENAPPKLPAAPTLGVTAGKMTARAAVTAYQSNTFGFRKRYGGKTLEIDGPVRSIIGSATDAQVQIVGIKEPNGGISDTVLCIVNSPRELQNVTTLASGQHVTATGVYTPDDDGLGRVMIELVSCSLK
jgi:hypothetical protein